MNEHFTHMVSQLQRIEKEAADMFGGKCNPKGYHGQYISYTDIVSMWDNYKDDIRKEGSTWYLEDYKLTISNPENYVLFSLNVFLRSYYDYISS